LENNWQAETVETAAAEVTTDVDGEYFDSIWEGDDSSGAEEDDFDMEEADGEEAEADQQEAEETEAVESKEQQAEEQAEPKQEAEEQGADQQFVLKHLGEVKTVNRDEVIALAQKGLDYDRKVEKLTDENADYKEFLQELADINKLDIKQLMQTTRARLLKTRMAQEGKEISESEALLTVQKQETEKAQARAQAKQDEAKKLEEQKQAEAEQKKNADVARFVENFPNVKAEEIPQSVWEEVRKGADLTAAYARYQNAELKKEIEALKLNEKNRTRSTGSRKTAGASAAKDPFDDGWGI
jgi:hypothetical protein